MEDPAVITLIAGAVAVVLGALSSLITNAISAKSIAKKSDLDIAQQANAAIQQSNAAEIARLSAALIKQEETSQGRRVQIKELFDQIITLRNENVTLIQKQADTEVQCTRDKAELMVRIVALEAKLALNPIFSGETPVVVRLTAIDPAIEMPVAITRVDADKLPALPVSLTSVREDVIVPMELKRPIPLLMTLQEKADAAQKAADEEKKE